jgi:hypothetical protein
MDIEAVAKRVYGAVPAAAQSVRELHASRARHPAYTGAGWLVPL